MRCAVAVTCQDCDTGVLAVLGCWPGPQRRDFFFIFYYPSACGVSWLCCWASGCVSEARLVLGDGSSRLSDMSIGEIRVDVNLCFEKLQVYARILGCLWAVSLSRSPKAEVFHIWKAYTLYVDCIPTCTSPAFSIFFCCLI